MVDQLKPAPISRIPRGLLAFLGLRTGGRNPAFLRGDVQPVLDVERWMQQSDTEQFQVGSQNANVLGDFDWLAFAGAIPQTQGRWVLQYQVRCIVPAGSTLELQPTVQIRLNGTGARASFAVGPKVGTSQAVASEIVVAHAPYPFWQPPDSILGFMVTRVSGAGPFPTFAGFRYNSFDL